MLAKNEQPTWLLKMDSPQLNLLLKPNHDANLHLKRSCNGTAYQTPCYLSFLRILCRIGINKNICIHKKRLTAH